MTNRISATALKLFTIAFALGLGACDLPERPADYREAHPIGVQPETRTLSLTSRVESEPLSPEDQFGFDRFVRDYHMRASGPVGIQIPANSASGLERKSRIERMQDLLVSAGVDRRMIRELPMDGEKGSATTISFATSKVSVPQCGDWSATSGFNWANRRSPNYGCATQRNLGLTIANPNDLKGAQTTESYDGNRGASVIETFRNPAAGAAAPEATATAQ